MKAGTVALVVQVGEGDSPQLIEAFSDEREIAVLEKAFNTGESDPLELVHELRSLQSQEDEDFGDYVEDLLSRPFVRPEVQAHGVQWFRSKMRIEAFEQSETQARQVIADFAFKVFAENPDRTDFILSGPTAKVRVRIFAVSANYAKKKESHEKAA